MIRTAIVTLDTMVANPLPAMDSGVTEVGASRNAAGMVTVDVNGRAVDDDYAGGATPAGSGDWNSVTLTKTNANVTPESSDTVVLYTDIAAPSDMLLTAVYTEAQLDNALTVSGDDDKRAGKAKSADFPSAP